MESLPPKKPQPSVMERLRYVIIGLLLGLGVGFVGALLLAPEKRERREGSAGGEEPAGEEGFGENHDSMAGLRRTMRGLQEQLQEAWEEAREVVSTRLAEHAWPSGSGVASFAALSSAKCTNEENYLLQKFTRGVMGTNSIDHCARV